MSTSSDGPGRSASEIAQKIAQRGDGPGKRTKPAKPADVSAEFEADRETGPPPTTKFSFTPDFALLRTVATEALLPLVVVIGLFALNSFIFHRADSTFFVDTVQTVARTGDGSLTAWLDGPGQDTEAIIWIGSNQRLVEQGRSTPGQTQQKTPEPPTWSGPATEIAELTAREGLIVGRVRIGDLRCCGTLRGRAVYFPAIYDERFDFARNPARPDVQQMSGTRSVSSEFPTAIEVLTEPEGDIAGNGGATPSTWPAADRAIANTVRMAVEQAVADGHERIAIVADETELKSSPSWARSAGVKTWASGLKSIRPMALEKVTFVVAGAAGTPPDRFTNDMRLAFGRYWSSEFLELFQTPVPLRLHDLASSALPEFRSVFRFNLSASFNPLTAVEPGYSFAPLVATFAVYLILVSLYVSARNSDPADQPRLTRFNIGVTSVGGTLGGLAMMTSQLANHWVIEAAPAGTITQPMAYGGYIAFGTLSALIFVISNKAVLRLMTAERESLSESLEELATRLSTALQPDAPITKLADDRLRFGGIVRSLKTFLTDPETRPPLVIGINGPWGSGKSSVMRMLQDEVEKPGRFECIWFNAWHYGEADKMLAGLLQRISEKLSTRASLRLRLALLWARILEQNFVTQIVLLSPLAIAALSAVALFAGMSLDAFDALTKEGASVDPITLNQILAGVFGPLFESAWDQSDTAVTVGGASVLSGSGILVWLAFLFRMSQPFKKVLNSLPKDKDHSLDSGFFAEFKTEFALYANRLPKGCKFVVFIDDLDRCPHDAVVEMLKAINLIINGGKATEQTVFVVGCDQQFVLDCVELHFKDFAARVDDRTDHPDERFGPKYLKKMITLSVSVPKPNTDDIINMLERLESAPDTTTGQRRDGQSNVSVVWQWARQKAGQNAAALVLIGIIAVFAVSTTLREPTTLASSTPISAPGMPRETRITITTLIFPALTPPAAASGGPVSWTLLLLAALGCGLSGRMVARGGSPTPEPDDDTPIDRDSLLNHFKRCRDLLPDNPRDVLRLNNAIHVGHDMDSDGAPGKLELHEFVHLFVVRHAFPRYFDPDFAEDDLIPVLRENKTKLDALSVPRRLAWLRTLPNVRPGLVDAIKTLWEIRNEPSDVAPFFDPDKLQRFIDVHRYIFELSEETMESASQPPTRPNGA